MKAKIFGTLILLATVILVVAFYTGNSSAGAVTVSATIPSENVKIVVSGAADVETYRKNPSEYVKNALIKLGYQPTKVAVTQNKAYAGPGIIKITIRCKCCSWCKQPNGSWICCEWCCEEE